MPEKRVGDHEHGEVEISGNTHSLQPLKMGKADMKMAMMRGREERPLSGQLLGGLCGGRPLDRTGEAVPTDRKHQHSTPGSRNRVTRLSPLSEDQLPQSYKIDSWCFLVWGLFFSLSEPTDGYHPNMILKFSPTVMVLGT